MLTLINFYRFFRHRALHQPADPLVMQPILSAVVSVNRAKAKNGFQYIPTCLLPLIIGRHGRYWGKTVLTATSR